jgi:hypothetical protein
MNKMKKLDENQKWTMVMILLPFIILMNVGQELANDEMHVLRIVYGVIFGCLGGLIGFTTNYLTKDKSRIVKLFATITLIAISALTIHLLSSNPTDAEILEQEWITQKIGNIEFNSPTNLSSINILPSDLK